MSLDRETGILKVEGKDVVQAIVCENQFKITWINEDWAKWSELHNSEELKTMKEDAGVRLANSRARTSKGAGKGPAH